jgi:ribosome modulation factor
MAKKLRAPTTDSKAGKKKGRAAKPAPLLLGSAADDVVKDVYERALKAKMAAEKAAKDAEPYKAEIKSAEGVFRAVLKDGKKKGVDPDDILWRLAQRSRSVEDIDKENKRRNRLAFLTNLPIGTQLGMFEDGKTTIATAIENAAKGDRDEVARNLGREAGKAGKPQSTCIYAEGTPQHDAWLDGWAAEQKALALGVGRGRNGGASASAH